MAPSLAVPALIRRKTHEGSSEQEEGTLAPLYSSMLVCAERQAAAIRDDDWDRVGQLSQERTRLLAESGQRLAAGPVADAAAAASLIEKLLQMDATTQSVLTAKRDEMRESMQALQRTALATTQYRAVVPSPSGSFIDSTR